jgi:hypothetical protein
MFDPHKRFASRIEKQNTVFKRPVRGKLHHRVFEYHEL